MHRRSFFQSAGVGPSRREDLGLYRPTCQNVTYKLQWVA